MQRSLFHCFLFSVLCSLGLPLSGLAQTITVGALSSTTVCSGKATVISVPFTTTGSFGSTNTFAAQLSNTTGLFNSSPTNIGTLTTASSTTAATTRIISATISGGIAAGTGYQVRVVSLTTPVKTSSNTAGLTITNTPDMPGISPVSYCLGDTATPLSASAVSGAMLNWYTAATGGTPSSIAPTPDTKKTGSTPYYVSQSLNGCESARVSIAVTVNGKPATPSVQASFSACQNDKLTALTATADDGNTLRWYAPNSTAGSYSSTAPAPDNQNTAVYYVSQARGSCVSSPGSITVAITKTPAAPAVSSPVTSYCPGQTATPLSATASTGGTLNWYGTNSTAGTSSSTATVPSTTSSGTTIYYVSQTVGNCESPRAAISVTVKPTPATPTVTNLSLCQNRSASALTASGVTGTINWYSPASNTPSTTAPTPSVTATGATSYSVSQTVNECESSKVTLTVTVNAVPAVPTVAATGPTYCQGVSAQPLSATGTALLWYGTNQTGGTGNSTATIPSTGSTGQTPYYVTQTANGCVSDRAGITVTVKTTPARPDVVNVTFCQNTNAPGLTATASSGATLNWYGTNQTGGTRTDSPPIIPTTTATTYTYYVSQTLDGCESASRSPITAQVKQTPGAPTVAPVDYCNNDKSQQLNAVGNSIKWYDASGTALSGAPTPPTNAVGTQTYQATQTVDGCESPQKPLTVTIKALPGQPGVTNLSYCQPTQDQPAQNVGPLIASGDNLRWYNTDGNPFQSAPTPPVTQVGTYTYQVSQTVNGCEGGRATLQVAVNSTPAPTVTTPLVTYCINTTAAPLQATSATGASLRWLDPYNRTFTEAPTPSTLNSNVVAGGDPFYVYQIGSNGCYSSRSTIRVVVNVAPTLALNGASEVNLGTLAPVKLSFTGAPPFSYTLTDGYSGISRTNDTTIYVLPRGNTTYQIVSVANSCGVGLPGNPATATITVRVPVITTSALQTTTFCAGSSFAVPFTTTGQFTAGNLFTAELVSVADTSRKTRISPNGTTGSIVTAVIPLTLTAGQYYVRVRGSNPSVGITGSNSPSVLTVRARATATLTGTQSIYEGSPATLTLTFGGEAPWTATYADSLRSYTVTATSSPYALEVQPARATTYRLTGVSNNCGVGTAVSGSALVTVQKVLGVEDPSLGPLVNVYPVPAGATLTVDIDVSLLRDPAMITLHDASGRPVLNQTTRSRQTTLDVNQQPAGTYLLRIQIGDRQLVRRILKQ